MRLMPGAHAERIDPGRPSIAFSSSIGFPNPMTSFIMNSTG